MSVADEPVDGLVQVWVCKGQLATIAHVLESLRKRRVPLVARIDHAAAARVTGLELTPTELLIFGNAAAGTPLMCARRSIAIDLPLKLLVQQESAGYTGLSYDDPAWIARRHHLFPESNHIVVAMGELLAGIVRDAVEEK